MNYASPINTLILAKRCREYEEEIDLLERQRDVLTTAVYKIANLYSRDLDDGPWLASAAMCKSSEMENEFLKQRMQADAHSNPEVPHVD